MAAAPAAAAAVAAEDAPASARPEQKNPSLEQDAQQKLLGLESRAAHGWRTHRKRRGSGTLPCADAALYRATRAGKNRVELDDSAAPHIAAEA
jgi:hypothetical protein